MKITIVNFIPDEDTHPWNEAKKHFLITFGSKKYVALLKVDFTSR